MFYDLAQAQMLNSKSNAMREFQRRGQGAVALTEHLIQAEENADSVDLHLLSALLRPEQEYYRLEVLYESADDFLT